MIRSLRRKLVLAAMAAFVVTMAIIGVAINTGYATLCTVRTDAAIEALESNDGSFPEQQEQTRQSMFDDLFTLTRETSFHTRYFVVCLDEQGIVVEVDIQNISSLDDDDAVALAQSILDSGKNEGYHDYYRFHVYDNGSEGTSVIVVDCFVQMQAQRNIAAITIGVMVICTLVALAIFIPLSGRVIRPFAENLTRQQRFVTDASHELKTPLAIISANVDLMEAIVADDGNTDAGQASGKADRSGMGANDASEPFESEDRSTTASELSPWISSTRTQVARLNGLVRDLVELARGDERRSEPSFEVVNLSTIVSQAARDFDALSATKGIALSFSITSDVNIQGCAEDLARVCGILLDNAMKYCDTGGQVRVTLEKRRRVAELRVSNPCATLTDEQVEHLFDRFWRADGARTHVPNEGGGDAQSSCAMERFATSRSLGGHGLGLSIAQSIITINKGKIEARLEGSTVVLTVTLPLVK